MINRGEPVPQELMGPFEEADEKLFKNVRAIFGGNVRHATSGAAPIAREILEFFWACGVPVLEGYGMTETATAATVSTVENHRFGTVGRALPGVELKIAEDGEILIKGANIFHGYHNQASTSFGAVEDGWLHTGDLGSIDEDGYLSITGRKKDIIITAGGKNLTPANIENDLKQSRWISQAVMHGDQRPYPVVLITLDEEEMPIFAREHGLPEDIPSLSREPAVQALIQQEIDRANAKYAQVEQVKKFVILDHDLSQPTGELTPTLKVKRNVVNETIRGPVRRAVRQLTCSRPHSCEHGKQMRSDPSDNGGLFVGRRPGTAPVHFRALPKRGSELRQRVDGSLAGLMLAAITLLCLLCWGPIPLACLWLGSQRRLSVGQRQPGHPRLVHRAVRAAVRRARAHAAPRQRMDPGAPRRRPRSAHRGAGADLRRHRGDLRARLRALVPRHPRAGHEPGDPRRRLVRAAPARGLAGRQAALQVRC